jgi:hypothetical protein
MTEFSSGGDSTQAMRARNAQLQAAQHQQLIRQLSSAGTAAAKRHARQRPQQPITLLPSAAFLPAMTPILNRRKPTATDLTSKNSQVSSLSTTAIADAYLLPITLRAGDVDLDGYADLLIPVIDGFVLCPLRMPLRCHCNVCVLTVVSSRL